MTGLVILLDEARKGDSDEPTYAQRIRCFSDKIEHEICEALELQRKMPRSAPRIALRVLMVMKLLLDRSGSKIEPDDLDKELGYWLLELDQRREILDFVACVFKGTNLEAEVDFILN